MQDIPAEDFLKNYLSGETLVGHALVAKTLVEIFGWRLVRALVAKQILLEPLWKCQIEGEYWECNPALCRIFENNLISNMGA